MALAYCLGSVHDLRGNPVEPRGLCELKRQSWEFGESKIARVCRTDTTGKLWRSERGLPKSSAKY